MVTIGRPMISPGPASPAGRSAPRRSGRSQPPARVQRLITGAHVWLYRVSRGRLGGGIGGRPVVLLTTTGRKSGKSCTPPLGDVAGGDTSAVVALNAGAPGTPAWWLNLKQDQVCQVQVGSRKPIYRRGTRRAGKISGIGKSEQKCIYCDSATLSRSLKL